MVGKGYMVSNQLGFPSCRGNGLDGYDRAQTVYMILLYRDENYLTNPKFLKFSPIKS